MKVFDWIRRLFGRPTVPADGQAPPPRSGPLAPKERRPARLSTLLQFEEKPSGPETDVVIGLDFGTSSAKVAIQTPYMLGGRVTFVDFGPAAHPSARHLLPVALHVAEDGSLSLERQQDHVETRGHLKLELLASDGRREPQREQEGLAWSAAFVGLTLRAARRYFLETQWDAYGHHRLRWSFNLGIPSAGYDDDAIRQRFASVAHAGWALSLRESAPTLNTALAALEQASAGLGEHVPGDVLPEVIAQAVGYARSRKRRDGLHVVLDMGASTLDLCAFVLNNAAGEDGYHMLTADVQLLGLLELHHRRMGAAGHTPPFDSVPQDLVEPLPAPERAASEAIREEIRAADARLIEEIEISANRTLRYVKRYRDPNAPAWRGGVPLPLFLAGGGGTHEVVRSAMDRSNRALRRAWIDYAGLRPQSFPIPEEVSPDDPLTEQEFARLAVAFGLSFPNINVGQIDRPGDVPDVPVERRARDWQKAYVSMDQV